MKLFSQKKKHTVKKLSSFWTQLCLASQKWDTGKQCRSRTDAATRGVWSGSTMFALTIGTSIKHGNNQNWPDSPYIGNGPVQRFKVEESTRHKGVKVVLADTDRVNERQPQYWCHWESSDGSNVVCRPAYAPSPGFMWNPLSAYQNWLEVPKKK